jgi:hypothetical protein
MHALKGATLEHLNFAAGVTHFLGGRPQDCDRQTDVIRDPGEGYTRARRGRGDNVVAAGMTDSGQRVVLGANGYVQRTAAGPSYESGRKVCDSAFHLEPGIAHHFAHPGACELLFKAQFRMGVDPMTKSKELRSRHFD